MNKHISTQEGGPNPLRKLAAIGAAAGVLLLPAACSDPTEKTGPVKTTTTEQPVPTTEVPSTTIPGNSEKSPNGELDPNFEAAKQQVANDLIEVFKKTMNGEVSADKLERGGATGSDSRSILHTVGGSVNGLNFVLSLQEAKVNGNGAEAPNYLQVERVSARITEPGGGEPTSDNPNGDRIVADMELFKPSIEGQPGRVDLGGTGVDGKLFNTQDGDLVPDASHVLGGTDAVAAANGVVAQLRDLLNIS